MSTAEYHYEQFHQLCCCSIIQGLWALQPLVLNPPCSDSPSQDVLFIIWSFLSKNILKVRIIVKFCLLVCFQQVWCHNSSTGILAWLNKMASSVFISPVKKSFRVTLINSWEFPLHQVPISFQRYPYSSYLSQSSLPSPHPNSSYSYPLPIQSPSTIS